MSTRIWGKASVSRYASRNLTGDRVPRAFKFALAALLAAISMAALPAIGQAANLGVVFDQTSPGAGTGGAPFDADDTPGNDSGPANDIVRTNDQITYHWGINVNGGASPDTTITQTLPEGMEWVGLPAYCLPSGTPPSGISPDGRTITCNLGDKANGTADDYYPIAKVLGGEVVNGDTLTTSITVSSSDAQTSPVTSPEVTAIVSSMPRVNLSKQAAVPELSTLIRDGVWGTDVTFPVTLQVDAANGKGSLGIETLSQPITFTDNLSGSPATTELIACDASAFVFPELPDSSGGTEDSVTDSGTITCTQPGGPGTPIEITIDGADLSGEHVPTRNQDGSPVPANRAYLATYLLTVFVPMDSVPPNGGLNVADVYEDFDPDGLSGTSNFGPGGEPIEDNTANVVLNRSDPEPGFLYGWKCYQASGSDSEECMTDPTAWGPNQTVVPGQTFWATMFTGVGGTVGTDPVSDIVMCDLIDNTTYNLTLEGTLPGAPANTTQPAWNQQGWVIEYGTGGTRGPDDGGWFAPGDGQQADDCDDDSSPTGWTTDASSVPGGLEAITKVRMISDGPVGVGSFPRFQMNLKVRNDHRASNELLPNGTILANFGNFKYTDASGQQVGWAANDYDPNTSGGNIGARVVLSRGDVRISKDTVPPGQISASTGDVVTYELSPTVTGYEVPGTVVRDVVVEDTLSEHLTYQVGSANPAPASVTDNGDGTTTLRWELGDRDVNEPVPPITYDARVKLNTPNGQDVPNTVLISSPDDLSDDPPRTDIHSITVNRIAGILVVKTTSTPWVEPHDDLEFQVEYANNSSTDLDSMDTIDVLPYDGDGRGSSFSGTARLKSVTVHDGETVYYTSRAPGSISNNPQDPSNDLAGGATRWCLTGELGSAGCPASVGDSTGVRVINTSTVEVGESHLYDLVFETDGNRSGDIYVNDVGLAGEGVSLPAFSAPVQDQVVSSALGDYVWLDQNGDGVQDAGEPPVPNVTVNLTGTDKHGDPVDRTTTTDANGLYRFGDLISGDYEITFVAPNGYGFTVEGAGSAGTDSNADPATGGTGPITIESPVPTHADQEDLTWDAGLIAETGSITIVKDAVPDTDQDFSFSATGGLTPADFVLNDDGQGSENERVFDDVDPGTYTVGEEDIPDGWDLVDIVCTGSATSTPNLDDGEVEIDVGPGEAATCTFTNLQLGSLLVIKDSRPDADEDFDFSTTGGLAPASFTLNDDGEGDENQQLYPDVAPGTFTVTEEPKAGWELADLTCTGSDGVSVDGATATIDLASDEAVVCTYTNVKDGRIEIVKEAKPEGDTPFSFRTTGGLAPGDAFNLTDDGSDADRIAFQVPGDGGSYTVGEGALPQGWKLTGIECEGDARTTTDLASAEVDITVGPGQTTRCTFTNERHLSDIKLEKDSVEDSFQVGRIGTYKLVATNLGPDDDTNVVVTDRLPEQLTFVSASDGCGFAKEDRTVTCRTASLPVGASHTFTVKVRVKAGSEGQRILNTARVDGDNFDICDGGAFDPACDNNEDDDVKRVKLAPRLVLKKKANVKKAEPGDRVKYTILFRNARKGTVATNVRICDTLPRHMSLVTTGGGKLENGKLCWTIKRLPHSGKKWKTRTFTMRIDRDVKAGTKLVNLATSGKARGKAVVRVTGTSGVSRNKGGGVTG